MKKNALAVLVLMLAMSLLAACGGNANGNASSPASQPESDGTSSGASAEVGGKIKVLTHRTDYVNDGTMDKYVENFKEKYPNAEIEFEALTNYAADIKVRLTTGEAGDVNMVDASLALNEMPNYYEPLPDSMFENVYFADYRAVDGKRYAIATGVNTQGIVYNKQAFAKAGVNKVPTTLDELYAAAQKLKDAGIIPLYMNYGAQWPIGNWAEGSVKYVAGDMKWFDKLVTDDAPFKVDGPWGTMINIARTFVQKGWVEKDLATNNWEMSKGEVASGKAAMYFLGNWVIPQVIGAGANPDDIGFFPLPYDNSGQYNAPLGPDYFIGVSKDSKNKELAIAWVEFFVKESGYVDQSGFMPVDKTIEPQVPQLAEFKSFNPTFLEDEATDPRFNEIANKAAIDLYVGKTTQSLIVAKDLQAEYDKLNKKWADSRKALGY
ncbi:ABC transporter substrate-binding protein [Paenibacillus darwinianus]|uniref:ABC transporter substrate-binding protein n=1 Tax=Paenibacillus darwinianus TaxID=1380763 RepID=A0A9W5S0A9_9BACL|nr:extracellular solute-binding protein [Paenibacillus darwinianus]EXX86459.1 ABC transporter substrate-binding protein [Paenibacillus darwinianus]EXX91048.1 ABC transporter substrate-binding protein [Paenibacillus darwinianus]EXX92010.1 ABC transporter substrate-binding protein [Paenibacillus darwinianus]